MLTILLAILFFVLLIFPHELGHFLVAKLVHVQVNEFAFGMGPVIWKRQGKETLYSIRLLPIGGFCAMEGENEESENDRAFNNKPAWAKISVLLAGSAMNVLIALVITSILLGITGFAMTTIGQVQEGRPAQAAGLQAGDQILSMDGVRISKWADIGEHVTDDKYAITVVVLRDKEEKTIRVIPEKDAEEERYIIGIVPKVTHNPLWALKYGVITTWNMTKVIYQSFGQLFSGKAKASDISGPVGMVSLVQQASKTSLFSYFYLLALISVNLAIFNLFPFPALDGGRIIFTIIRLVTGRMITDRQEAIVHGAGMLFLLSLMILVTGNDIMRIIGGGK